VFIEYKPEFVVYLAAHIDDRASVRTRRNAEHNIWARSTCDASRGGSKRAFGFYVGCLRNQKTSIEETAIPRPLTHRWEITGRYMKYFSPARAFHVLCAWEMCMAATGWKQRMERLRFTQLLAGGSHAFGDGLTTRPHPC
jgi:hypothetical protein